MWKKKTIAILMVAATAGSTGLAQSLAQAPDGITTSDENQGAVNDFLATKSRMQANRDTRIQARGSMANKIAIRNLLIAAGPEKPRPFADLASVQVDRLHSSLIEDISQLAVMLDLDPARISQLRQAGFDPLVALTNFVRGTSTLSDQALLSDLTVVAIPKSVVYEDLGDGFGSTLTLDLVDSLVGDGSRVELKVRQRSGVKVAGGTAMYVTDIRPNDRNKYVFSLSRGLYDAGASEAGQSPRLNGKLPSFFAALGTRYLVDEDRALPDFGSAPPTTISSIKASLESVARIRGPKP